MVTVDDVIDVVLLGRVPELHGAARETMATDAARGGAPAVGGGVRVDGDDAGRRATTLAQAQLLAMGFSAAPPEEVDALCASLVAGDPLAPVEVAEVVALAGVGALALAAAEDALVALEVAAARTWAALGADTAPADALVGRLLPLQGLRLTLDALAPLLADVEPGGADVRALRLLPQRHGAARDALRAARDVVETHLLGVPLAAPRRPDGPPARTGNDDPEPLRLALGAAERALAGACALALDRLALLDAPLPPVVRRDGEEPRAAAALRALAGRCADVAEAESAAAAARAPG